MSESSQPAGPYVPTRPRTLGVYREKGDGRHGCTPDLDPMRTLRCDPWREGREAARPRGDPTALAEARPSRGPVRPSRAWTGPLGGDWPPREKPWWTWHWGSGPRPSAPQVGTPTRAKLPPTTLPAAALLPSPVEDLMLHVQPTMGGRDCDRMSWWVARGVCASLGHAASLGALRTGPRRSRKTGEPVPRVATGYGATRTGRMTARGVKARVPLRAAGTGQSTCRLRPARTDLGGALSVGFCVERAEACVDREVTHPAPGVATAPGGRDLLRRACPSRQRREPARRPPGTPLQQGVPRDWRRDRWTHSWARWMS